VVVSSAKSRARSGMDGSTTLAPASMSDCGDSGPVLTAIVKMPAAWAALTPEEKK